MNFAFGITLPITMSALELPIQVLDKIVCKSLDVVEHQVPSIHLTPEKVFDFEIIINTIMSDLVK